MDWTDRLAALSATQRAALAQRLSAMGVAADGGQPRLVAYLTAREAASLSIESLRDYLKGRLPEYMVPTAFVVLDDLPRTPNGKVDRNALPAPESVSTATPVAPTAASSATEVLLAEIWSAVLGVEPIDVHDNFFEIGGDSIMSIQIVARARRAGLTLRPGDLFDHPTIASLARELAAARPVAEASPGPTVGRAPLTPIQRWLFDQPLTHPEHWNQALLLRASEPLDRARLDTAMEHLVQHHPALRTAFITTEAGWQQEPTAPAGPPSVEDHDLRGRTLDDQTTQIDEVASRLHRSLSLATGQLLRVARFRVSDDDDRLLLLAHHLVVDAVSWQIIVEDLGTAYRQLQQRRPVALPPTTTPYDEWSRRLDRHGHALEPSVAAYWTDRRFQWPYAVPCDQPAGLTQNTVRTARTWTVALTGDETHALLHELPAVYHTQINEVLLTALGQTLAPWIGAPSVLVAVEGHGREAIDETVDVSRTVGWFTSVYPVLLDIVDSGDLGQTLMAVKEQLRAVPDRGLSHGLLRYRPDLQAQFGELTEPAILFNYLGRIGAERDGGALFWLERDGAGQARHLDDARRYLIEINCVVQDGCFQAIWNYSEAVHQAATIQRLAAELTTRLRRLIEHGQSDSAGGHSPSDFPLADLDSAAFGQIAGLLAKLESE